jgi:hypothetical protein
MDAFLWAALGVFVIAVVGGLTYVGLRAWQAWSAFASLAAAGAAGAERIVAQAEQLAARGERATVRLDELRATAQRLQRSQARARILLAAFGEFSGLLQAARALVSTK